MQPRYHCGACDEKKDVDSNMQDQNLGELELAAEKVPSTAMSILRPKIVPPSKKRNGVTPPSFGQFASSFVLLKASGDMFETDITYILGEGTDLKSIRIFERKNESRFDRMLSYSRHTTEPTSDRFQMDGNVLVPRSCCVCSKPLQISTSSAT